MQEEQAWGKVHRVCPGMAGSHGKAVYRLTQAIKTSPAADFEMRIHPDLATPYPSPPHPGIGWMCGQIRRSSATCGRPDTTSLVGVYSQGSRTSPGSASLGRGPGLPSCAQSNHSLDLGWGVAVGKGWVVWSARSDSPKLDYLVPTSWKPAHQSHHWDVPRNGETGGGRLTPRVPMRNGCWGTRGHTGMTQTLVSPKLILSKGQMVTLIRGHNPHPYPTVSTGPWGHTHGGYHPRLGVGC